ALVPPLVLQPLVENAVKHGVRLLEEGGLIDVEARRDGARLELRVSNPVEAAAPRDSTGLGQGLRLLQERLAVDCSASAFVDVERTAGMFTVRISLPWQT
ncbi:MAG TPA: sensor histidine kinase, partial [Albitalea sp.]|nr:sensor histidine kinase [Albitalea sp.]